MIGWYVFVSVMLVSIDFPIQIPIGDLHNVIKGHSETKRIVRGPFAGKVVGGPTARDSETAISDV